MQRLVGKENALASGQASHCSHCTLLLRKSTVAEQRGGVLDIKNTLLRFAEMFHYRAFHSENFYFLVIFGSPLPFLGIPPLGFPLGPRNGLLATKNGEADSRTPACKEDKVGNSSMEGKQDGHPQLLSLGPQGGARKNEFARVEFSHLPQKQKYV